MTSGALEQVLYDLGTSGRTRKVYMEDPAAFLSRYPLQGDEAELIQAEDVATLMKRGVNPMLLMGFYLGFHGPKAMPEYLSKVPALGSLLKE